MKKTILFMILVLLVCLTVIPAAAAAEDHPHNADHCVCGGAAVGVGDHAQCTDIQWTPLSEALEAVGLTMSTANFGKLPSGNYYLDGDVTVTGSSAIGSKKDSLATTPDTVVELSICLNGYTISRQTGRVFGSPQIGSVLNICDCSYDGSSFGGTVAGGKNQYGSVVYTNCLSVLNIYGGNFTGKGYTNGGAIVIGCDNCGDVDGNGKYEENDRQTAEPAVFNLYNGYITGSSVTASGGTIQLFHHAGMNVYGGTVVGGTAGTSGGLIAIGKGTVAITGGTMTGGTCKSGLEVVQVIQNDGKLLGTYTSFADGLAKAQNAGNCYMRLINDLETTDTVSGTLYLDLNGYTLKGIHITGTLYGMDSTTNGYDGSAAGALIPASGKPQTQVKTTQAQVGAVRRYAAVNENGSYSFHRFYMAIHTVTVRPSTNGMGYKATFVGSDYLKAHLSTTAAYGYKMWLTEDTKITRGYPASRFGGEQELTLRIDNFVDASLSAEQNGSRLTMPLYACVYLRLADGTVVETEPVHYTFRETLEAVNLNYSSYNATKKNALDSLGYRLVEYILTWDVSNIHHKSLTYWKKQTGTSFNTLLTDNSSKLPSGNYYLTEDVDIGSKTITISSGSTVNLCLNGYTLSSSGRLFKQYGTLNLCDCHTSDAEGTYQSSYTIDTDDTDIGEYAPIMYCYYNSVTNLYGGNIKATGPVTYAGLIAVSHDGSKTNAAKPAAVFNMYGGTIHGNVADGSSANNKTASGGAVCVWNGSSMNMYGGTITGGTATHGGSIIITSSSTMNMYGGTITGGKAINGAIANGSTAGGKGGNIHNSGTLNIYGGTISGGSAQEGRGGNIFSSGTLNIYGGTVTGGSATVLLDENGEAYYCTGMGGGICMSGGDINISGNAVINGNDNYNLYLSYISNVDIKDLTGDAKIGIVSDIDCVISRDTSTASRLYSEQEGCSIYTANGKVQLGTSQPAAFDQNVSEFSVGYAIESIHPTEYGLKMSPWGNPEGRTTKAPTEEGGSVDGYTGIELFATVVAITDKANNTVLMITLDLQSIGDSFVESYSKFISDATGVPVDQIYISCTHTHNCPSLTTELPGNTRYASMVAERLITASVNAMADRAPATMKVGSFETYRMNFTRNYYYYLNNDTTTEPIYYGDQFGQAPPNGETIYRVREGDHTMHLLVFERTDKQPVLVSNWRAHPHRSGGMFMYTSDSDVIGATRNYFQENTDYLFAYFQGAAGNMNTTSRTNNSKYYSEDQRQFGSKTNDGLEAYIQNFGNELGRQIVENGFPNLKETETGLIQTDSIVYAAPVNHDDEIYYENAMRLWAYHKANPELMDSLTEQLAEANKILEEDLVLEDGTVLKAGTRKYEGVYSVYHAQQIIARHNLSETKNVSLNTFSIGDKVGICTSAGEIWDRVSEEIEERSPFETTFFIGYCDGGVGYIPYGVAGNYESYEYYSCVFKQDEVIIQIMDYLLGFLDKQHQNATK